jgi:hypothetical protein
MGNGFHCNGTHGSCEYGGSCECGCGYCLKERGLMHWDTPICFGDGGIGRDAYGCYKPLDPDPEADDVCACPWRNRSPLQDLCVACRRTRAAHRFDRGCVFQEETMAKISLRGAAAGAFVDAQSGVPATTDDERALRVATLVHMNMSRGGDERAAIALIKQVVRDGLDAAADTCTAKRGGS